MKLFVLLFVLALSSFECYGQSNDDALFEQLDKELRVEEAKLKIDQKKAERSRISGADTQNTVQNGLPRLIRIYGEIGRENAQFDFGDAPFSARKGEWVSREWKIVAIESNSVALRSKSGRATRLFVGSNRSVDMPVLPSSVNVTNLPEAK